MPARPSAEDQVHPSTRAEWRDWLRVNHTRAQGAWLVTFKKRTGRPRVEYAQAVEEALCFGWVDSKPRSLDDERAMLWFAPRKPKSPWSKLNKARVKKLIRDGLMTPAGLAKIAAAKKDGSWSSYDGVESLEIPADLGAALRASPKAKTHFDAFPPSSKKIILWWITTAKKPETRARRVLETVRLAENNERANHYRR